MKQRHIVIFTFLLMTSLLVGCVQEDGLSLANGKLHLSIGKVSTQTGSRATPTKLGKPLAEKFQLKIQRQGTQSIVYNGTFSELLEIKTGKYDITATCGENVKLGKDCPYYIGTEQAVVETDKETPVTIPCKVGNALVSVEFGQDDEEKQRFEKFYDDYGIIIKIGELSLSIAKDETEASIYFPAGSSPELTFYGTLKLDGGRRVSTILNHEDLPTVFQAADHAQITVSLPDPESAIRVGISKVELVEARLDETIPLSWLPVPTATAAHSYNNQGLLVGTKLTFSNAYPEMEWEARVSDKDGNTVRTIKGTGELTSEHTSSQEWPYLPKGKYKATYYLHTESGAEKVSSREFLINAPQFEVTLGGYTSHSLYEEGNITAANQADGHTIYDPQIVVKIAPELIAMKKYGYQMEYTFNDEIANSVQNTVTLNTVELSARTQPYVISADVTFDGVRVQKSRNYILTGIPFHFEPPTTDTWEKNGDVTDEGNYARFGNWSSGSQSLTYRNVAVPAGTHLSLDYKFFTTSDLDNTFTISAGDQVIVSASTSGYSEADRDGTESFTLSAATTSIRCVNSYGAGLSRTDLYRVGMKYRQQ
ncbi:MAG: DUF4493 domain-containing protein [Bacteroidaceae bacterium]|nr:DUF4493 domain-containing protein [Bacteroidaceae bacterium]